MDKWNVGVLIFEGVAVLDVAGPFEVLTRARLEPGVESRRTEAGALFDVFTVAKTAEPVTATGGLVIVPRHSFADAPRIDLLLVPGGFGTRPLLQDAETIEWIRRTAATARRTASVCTGALLLARAGLLDGRRATTHWGLVDEYRARFPAADWRPEELVTDSDGVYCGGGVHAALDLALYLVEKLCGRETALRCSRSLLIDMPRTCQAGFAVLPLGRRHADEPIRRAEDWIHRHCREEFRFEDLARQLGMSPRNFIRRFKQATGLPPVDYVQRLRVTAARRMLEEDERSVQEVCQAVGYEDAAFFRTLFKRHTGLSPAAYRRQSGARAVRA
jgi:transcriptional regulator GlxA family with amidase domain